MEVENSTQEILKRLAEQKFALDQSAIVAQTDARGIIEYVNEKFCKISGYNRSELIGQSHKLINSGYHSPEFFQKMWQSISRGEIWRGEICNRAKDGRLYWVYTTIVPFLDSEGRPKQYLAIRQDITSLKEAQQKIQEQQDQLIASSKLSAIGEMAATITHEINNPLGVILGRCEMLSSLISKGQIDTATLSRLVETIDVTAKRIEKIVKSMRSLAHQGEADPFLKTPVQSMIQDLQDLYIERFKSAGIKLNFNDFDKSLSLDCRSHEILQVLVNLINNAYDAICELEERWIRVEVSSADSRIQISVTDSGKGISEATLQKLFMPFFSTKRVQYGTGLGLTISRSLIQRHRGKLEYDRTSANTKFIVTLPIKQPC